MSAVPIERPASNTTGFEPGQLDRAPDPPAAAGRRVERILAVAIVAQEADASRRGRARASVSRDRVDEQLLQRRNAVLVGAASRARARRTGRDGRTRTGRARAAACAARSCDAAAVSRSSRSGRGMRSRVGEVMIELDARGHRRRAAVPRHDERAAGVGVRGSTGRRSRRAPSRTGSPPRTRRPRPARSAPRP